MKLYDTIKHLLQINPELRDSDKKLQWNIWAQQGYVKGDVMTYEAFMKNTLINPETIRRTRQKVQEKHPELQASKSVQLERNKKRKTKGTWIYREKINYRFEGDSAIPIIEKA